MALFGLFWKILCIELYTTLWKARAGLPLTLTPASLPSPALSMRGSCPVPFHSQNSPDPLYEGNDYMYLYPCHPPGLSMALLLEGCL